MGGSSSTKRICSLPVGRGVMGPDWLRPFTCRCREIDHKGRPFADIALQVNPSPALLNDSVDHGQSQTGSLSHLFRREVGVEHVVLDVQRDPLPRVTAPQPRISARLQIPLPHQPVPLDPDFIQRHLDGPVLVLQGLCGIRAPTERFFRSLKTERLDGLRFKQTERRGPAIRRGSKNLARTAVFRVGTAAYGREKVRVGSEKGGTLLLTSLHSVSCGEAFPRLEAASYTRSDKVTAKSGKVGALTPVIPVAFLDINLLFQLFIMFSQ